MSQKNRQFVLDQIPKGKLSTEHFRLTEAPIPSPAEGEVLLHVRYVSLDAANRAWMLGPTYRAALKAGELMAGGAVWRRSLRAAAAHSSRGTWCLAIPAGGNMPCCPQRR